jgi:stage IV sporulation protein FB
MPGAAVLSLPSLQFKLFGFPVAIGLDFLLIAVLFGSVLPGQYLVIWVAILAVSILVHELGHAFALRRYGITPQIRLWGMGGLTTWGFALPPRKTIVVSAAGPLLGVAIGLAAMQVEPRMQAGSMADWTVQMVVWVNLYWGLLNLLPIAALDGGNITTNAFVLVLGPRGRVPGLIFVALSSLVIAVIAFAIGFVYLAVIVAIFALLNPTPYQELRRILSTRTSASSGAAPASPGTRDRDGHAGGRSVASGAVGARRVFGEAYAETLDDRAGAVDLDDLETRPAPLISDVAAMVARGDDAGIAARLTSEEDPLTVLAIVARVVDGRRLGGVLKTLRRGDGRAADGLLKLQVGLFALGRFEDSIGAAGALGADGNAASALLVARCAARMGDRKLVRQGLERAVALGHVSLSDAALGDIARVGPDERVAELLTRLRATQTA